MNADLYRILEGTLASDKNVRVEAESQLNSLSQQRPDFPALLMRFATQPVGTFPSSRCHSVFLAAAVKFRNIISHSNWNRNPIFSVDIKEAIRNFLIPLQCEPHVDERIRRQLLAATNDILQYDYPLQWPQVVPQISEILHSATVQLSAIPLTAMVKTEMHGQTPSSSTSEEVVRLLLQLKGALGALRYCCKVYESPLDNVPLETADEFSATMIPSLLQLFEFLLQLWVHEAHRFHALGPTVFSIAGKTGEQHELAVSDLLAELSHCLRLTMKCFWSLCAMRWPSHLCESQMFHQFFHMCLQKTTETFHAFLLPIFQKRIEENVVQKNLYGDRFEDFQEASVWRLMKWIGAFMHLLIELFSAPKKSQKRSRATAKIFCEEGMLLYIVSYSQELIRWHSGAVSLTSKAYILALECLTLLVPEEENYTKFLLPAAEQLLVHLLFPRLAFTSNDVELWNLNPEEYVRKQSNPIGDLFNAKVVSSSLMVSLVVPSKAFHDHTLSQKLLKFVISQLETYSTAASQVLLEDPASPEMESPRRIDASFYCLYALARALKVSAWPLIEESLENILLHYVIPATSYPIGFLRARAVQLLSVYASRVTWSSAQSFHQVIQAVLPLLQDPETPVKVQTCASFSLFIHHPYAFEVINPCIAQVVAQYFQVLRMIDNEAVVRTLRKTIRYYSSSLSQWAIELTEMICQHFLKVMETASGKFASWNSALSDTANGKLEEDDNFVDVLMTADELLETLTVLVKSIPSAFQAGTASCTTEQGTQLAHPTDGECHISVLMWGIQERVAPLLQLILSYRGGSEYGFMDACLRLLTTLLSRSKAIAPSIWVLLAYFHRMVFSGAIDYFAEMLAPLDNFSSVEPIHFAVTPFGALCPPPPVDNPYFEDPHMMQWTPAQIVFNMGEYVFASPSIRLREKASVPKIYETVLQNYWWAVTMQTKGTGMRLRSTIGEGIPCETPDVTAPESRQAIRMLVDAVTAASLSASVSSVPTHCSTSPTMKILLANTVFSSLLVDWVGTCCAMQKMNMFPSFFEGYASLVSNPEVTKLLRAYDRRLVIAAIAEGIRGVQQCREGDGVTREWGELATALDVALQSLAMSQMLLSFAQLDEKEVKEETAALLKYKERREQKGNRGNPPDDGDETESGWEDEDEEDEMWENNMDDLEEDGEWGDDDAFDLDNRGGDLAQLIRDAQAAREQEKDGESGRGNNTIIKRIEKIGGENEMDSNVDDDDGKENLLQEEEGIEAPILDKVNVWMALADGASVARNLSQAAACFFSSDLCDQRTAITHAAEALERWNEVQLCGN